MAVEDFTTYTEVDALNRITVASTRVTWTDMQRGDDNLYIYKDKTAGYFNVDFQFDFTVSPTNIELQNGSINFPLVISNALGDYQSLIDGNEDSIAISIYRAPGQSYGFIDIRELDSGTEYSSTSLPVTIGNVYYVRLSRDESAGTYGTCSLSMWNDSGHSDLVGTISRTLHTSKKDFRYVMASVSADATAVETLVVSGYVENLNLFLIAVVTAQAPTAITSTTATGNGTIVSIGATPITAHGYCWATTIDPTTSDSKTDEGAGSLGVFESSIAGLTAGQKYWARPYAENAAGTVYGANVSFFAGRPGTLSVKGEFAVVQTGWHYIDEDGKERYITGTLV